MLKGSDNRQMESEMQKSTGKQGGYFQIYEQIYETPDISASQIAEYTMMAKNTVVKLLEEMHGNHVLFPPYLAMKPAENCAEYMHFLEFGTIDPVLLRLKRHPYVISYMRCEGAWNVLVTTSELMYFKDLAEDFCISLYRAKRGLTVTPKCSSTGSFEITGEKTEVQDTPDLTIDWSKKEWILYRLFGENMRREVQPVLREENIHQMEYMAWKKDVYKYCSVHTLFYPLGFHNYVHWFFLMETDIGISSLFEEWPCSCVFIDVNPFVLAHISAPAHEEKKLQILSQYLWDDLEITGFCADPLYEPQSRTYPPSQSRTKKRGDIRE